MFVLLKKFDGRGTNAITQTGRIHALQRLPVQHGARKKAQRDE